MFIWYDYSFSFKRNLNLKKAEYLKLKTLLLQVEFSTTIEFNRHKSPPEAFDSTWEAHFKTETQFSLVQNKFYALLSRSFTIQK